MGFPEVVAALELSECQLIEHEGLELALVVAWVVAELGFREQVCSGHLVKIITLIDGFSS